jgi:signal transduction histidine kinase/ActR/RegA family two-component response regulator
MTARPRANLLQPLAHAAGRNEAASALARSLGARELLLFVRDPALDVMLPAPGMPKTIAGGPAWRAFLRRCLHEPRPAGEVDLGGGAPVAAQGIVHEGAALVLLGASLDDSALAQLVQDFPLFAALLEAQQALHIGQAEAEEAREAAARAHDLARALDAARAAAAELNLQLRGEHERKDEFLAMLSHELRNPLAPLVNAIALLRRTEAGTDDFTSRQIDVMSRQMQQLTRLVDDLLEVSRISRGLIELQREPVRLSEVIQHAADAVQPLMQARGHDLRFSGMDLPVEVNGDPVRLTQVFANLLGNAAKYTDPGGRISVSIVSDEQRVSVVIHDNGIGIPQDMLTRVFEMFTQVPASQSHSAGGLGIGLTLVRRLVELHGGRVSAYSRGTGQGSTFTVSLPQIVRPPTALRTSRPLSSGGQEAATRSFAANAGLRVLVVDDNQDGGATMLTLVELMGPQARLAHDGVAALEIAATFDPHLILLDIGMPGMDGYETATRLRELPGMQARLVALTGYGSAHDRERALQAGFDDHLVKPLPPQAMEALLKDLRAMHEPS